MGMEPKGPEPAARSLQSPAAAAGTSRRAATARGAGPAPRASISISSSVFATVLPLPVR